MTDQLISSVVAIATAIIGLAVLAVLVSRNSKTTDVIDSAARGFAADLQAATSPGSGGGLGSGFTGLGVTQSIPF